MLCLLLSLALAVPAAQLGSVPQAETLEPLPDTIGLGGPIAGTHNGALIVGGGANFPTPLLEGGEKVWHPQLWVLPSKLDRWRPLAQLDNPLAYAACASSSRGIAVIGGSDSDQVYADAFLIQWDVEIQRVQFQKLPPLPRPTALAAAEFIGDQLFVLAGKADKAGAILSGDFWSLDLAAAQPSWQSLPTYPGPPRFKMATAVYPSSNDANVGGGGSQIANPEPELYLFSGSTADHRALTDAYRYQPSTQTWTRLADLPHAANAGAAMAWDNGNIYVLSGTTDADLFVDGEMLPIEEREDFSPRIQAYDVASNSWKLNGQLAYGMVTTRAVTWNDQIVLPSGETRAGIRTPSVQTVQPDGLDNLIDGEQASTFGAIDQIVLLLYLAVMLGVGVYFARRSSTTEDFFLAGRKIPWWAAGISIFGTQLSAITFMAIPATAFGSDWRRFAGSLMALPVFVIVIYFFLPRFRRLNITTAYEYLEQRFNQTIRRFASGLFILFQFGRMGIVLLLPAIALSAVTQLPTHICIALMGVLATAYTALGGISAVIWTDVLQVAVLIGGALACLLLAVNGAGGFDAAWTTAMEADKLQIFDWRWDPTEMVGWVLIVGFFFTNLIPYTTDQTIIQRYLTTPDTKQAARSMWLNLAITIPTGLLFYGLGTALYAYYQANPGELAVLPAKQDQLVPWFVVHNLPDGIAGIVIAGIFAAAMSSLDSSINSVTTAIMHDFMRKGDNLRLARYLTLILGAIGTFTALLLASVEIQYLFDFFQKLIGLFGGALAGVFLLAVFWKRCSSTGALLGLLLGSSLTIYTAFFTSINFLLYAVVGSLTCVAVGWISSWLRPR